MVKVYYVSERVNIETSKMDEQLKPWKMIDESDYLAIQAKLDKAVSVIRFYGDPDNMCDNAYDNGERTLGLINDADFSMAEWVDKTTGKTHSATHYGKVAREFLAEIGKG
jgi:hypothetical protein